MKSAPEAAFCVGSTNRSDIIDKALKEAYVMIIHNENQLWKYKRNQKRLMYWAKYNISYSAVKYQREAAGSIRNSD